MCKLDGMKACSKPLPLPEPFDQMWLIITKVYCLISYSVIITTINIIIHAGSGSIPFTESHRRQVQEKVQP